MSRLSVRTKQVLAFLGTVLLDSVLVGSIVSGQSMLRESLERLDTDNDGMIAPEEITPLARPYLERIAEARRLSLDKSNRIESYQEAARIYHALRNGVADRRIEVQSESTVKTFEPDPEVPFVPEFGLAEMKYPYIQEDLDEADRTLRRYDDNDDGFIDRAEADGSVWTHRDPFEMDLNRDDRLSRLELTQRYARRRLMEDDSSELIQRARRVGNGIRSSDPQEPNRRDDDSQWWRRGGSSYWLTASVLGRFDTNRNGRLETEETQELGIPAAKIDLNRDGELTRDELHAYLSEQQNESGDPAKGLPGWFYELDANRDGQVSMPEFETDWTPERIAEFDALDINRDGLLTAMEVVKSKSIVGGRFENATAEVLPPYKTIISEIEIADDLTIGDLDVQLSLTHTNVGSLDGYLTGPDGQRIELFSDVGGSGDHFDETIFDDQADTPIVKARPPFEGRFQPEGLIHRQPGLSHFTDKNAKGVWQLVIRGTRNERFGMLHRWTLLISPRERMAGRLAATPSEASDPIPRPTSVPAATAQLSGGQDQATAFQSTEKRGEIDYAAISRKFDDALQSGAMTQEEVRAAWIEIKSAGAASKDKGEKVKEVKQKDFKPARERETKERKRE